MKREFQEPNLFFWIPSDASHEEKIKQTEHWVIEVWKRRADPKNGGWRPEKSDNRRKVRVIPLGGLGADHAAFKEGYDTYLVRDKEWHIHEIHPTDKRVYASVQTLPNGTRIRYCNKFRFWRPDRITQSDPLWLPDELAAVLQKKGLMKVLEWDTQDGKILSEEMAEPVKPVEVQERGERVKTVVPQ